MVPWGRNPIFTGSIVGMMNLPSSVVPIQWKAAPISLIPKISNPLKLANWPISITPDDLSRHIAQHLDSVTCHQFAFQPPGFTTASLIQVIHIIVTLLESNLYVIIETIIYQHHLTGISSWTGLLHRNKPSRLKNNGQVCRWHIIGGTGV